MLNHMSAKPMWKAVIDPRSQDDVERLMIEHGSFCFSYIVLSNCFEKALVFG